MPGLPKAIAQTLLAVVLVGCANEPSIVAGIAPDASPAVDTAETAEAGPPDAAWPAPAAGSARIVALNVHRLFDETCDTGSCAPGDYEETATSAVIEKRTARLAATFRALAADVVLVEEIETAPLLDAIADRMPGPRWSRVLGETDAPASVDVGVLSRYPITDVKRHRGRLLVRPDGTYTNFARELLEVHLDVRGAELVVFCAHFRSKASDDPGRRYAEAVGARDLVDEVATARPDALVVLGGDLNDEPGSAPLLALDERLVRVSAWMPDWLIATFTFAGKPQAIDHFYIPRGNVARYVPRSFHAVKDPGAQGLSGSDHAGIVADFGGFPP